VSGIKERARQLSPFSSSKLASYVKEQISYQESQIAIRDVSRERRESAKFIRIPSLLLWFM